MTRTGSAATRFAIVLAVATLACAPARTARAGEFDDYRVPTHGSLQWTGGVSGSASWGSQSGDLHRDRNGSAYGSGILSGWGLAESERALTTWSVGASANGNRTHDSMGDGVVGTGYAMTQESWAHATGESAMLSATHRWWPGQARVHALVAASASGSWSQGWGRGQSDRWLTQYPSGALALERTWTRQEQHAWEQGATVAAGTGLGRVRDVTGAYEARLLEERLAALGLLAHPLTAAARRDLAALMTVRGSVEAAHDEPAALVWGEIARILTADGALRDGAMDAPAWWRLAANWFGRASRTDAAHVPLSPVTRFSGWLLEARFEGRTSRSNTLYDYASHTTLDGVPAYDYAPDPIRSLSYSDRAVAGLAAEFDRPLSMRLQASAFASLMADVRLGQHGFDEGAGVSLDWLAAPRWLVSFDASQSRTYFAGRNTSADDNQWSTSVAATAAYDISDRVSASVRAAQTQERLGRSFSATRWLYHRGQIVFGINYRFAGQATAPGLFPAR